MSHSHSFRWRTRIRSHSLRLDLDFKSRLESIPIALGHHCGFPLFAFAPVGILHIRCGARLYRLFSSRPTSLLLLVFSPAEYCALCTIGGYRRSTVERRAGRYRTSADRPGAGGKGIEDRGATKGDEWWERCNAGVYTLVWGEAGGWSLRERRLSSATNTEHNIQWCCVRVRACVRARMCCDEREQVVVMCGR
jgi:hypothetical protein